MVLSVQRNSESSIEENQRAYNKIRTSNFSLPDCDILAFSPTSILYPKVLKVNIILSIILNLYHFIKNYYKNFSMSFLCFRRIKNKNLLFLFQKKDSENQMWRHWSALQAEKLELYTCLQKKQMTDALKTNTISSFNRTCMLNWFIALHGIMTWLPFVTEGHEITRDALSFLYFFQTIALFVSRVWW